MMKVVELRAFGGVENLHDAQYPIPEPRAGEVRIRIRGISVNPVDTKMRAGNMGADLPMVLGRDVAGVVDAVGTGVTRLAEGDAVFGVLSGPRSNGAYAQYVTLPEAFAAHTPKGMSATQAAALGVAGLTAYECVVRKARPGLGDAVLVAGGAGGVGSFAIPMLLARGAGPILATAGSDASAAYLTQTLGVEPGNIVRYRGKSPEALQAEVRDRTGGRGVAVAFDFVGGAMKQLCFGALDFDGRVVSIVEEYDPAFELDLWRPAVSPLWAKSGSFDYVALSARARFGGPETWGVYTAALEALRALLEAGELPPPVVTEVGELSAANIGAAHTRIEHGGVQGKLVLRVS